MSANVIRSSIRWIAASMVAGVCLLTVPIVSGQNAQGPSTVVALIAHDSAPYVAAVEGFRDRLEEFDLDVDFNVYYLHDDPAEVSRIVDNLRNQPPDLILSLGSKATRLIVTEELETPIVAGLILDASVLDGSKNSTAVVLDVPVEIQLAYIKDVLPKYKTIGVLFNAEQNSQRIKAAEEVARSLGMKLVAQEVTEPREIPAALKALSRRVDVIWGIPDSVVLTRQTTKPVLLFSFRNRIPFVGLSSAWVKAGALYALERDYGDVGAQCAEMAVEVLNGKPVSSIPVSTPRTILLSLNTRTSEHMNVEIPAEILDRANVVFE